MKRSFRKILLSLLASGILLAGSWYVFHLRKMHDEFSQLQENEKNSSEKLASSFEKILDSTTNDEDLILVEMSLSLIQNYYVDAKQFDFEKLLLTTLENLKNNGDLVYKVTDQYFEITNGHIKKEIPKEWGKDELGKVATIFQIAQFLKDSQRLNDEKTAIPETLSFFIASLDPYSRLLSEEDYKELKEGTEGEFGGLGIMVGMRNDLLTVLKLLPHSPAVRAGIHPLDHILAVNGHATFGASLDELIKDMRGLPGSSATLSFLRDNDYSPFEVSMNRELVQIDPVAIQHLKTPKNNEVLLLKLDTFSVKSYDRLRGEIQKTLAKRPSLDGIIIDLRSNPGGLLDQAVKISKMLVPEGSIVTVEGRETETEYANHENLNLNCPVIVLIDEDSASASEILAGALKDRDRAIIIGQPSYGKGTVQTIFELPVGRALKLTIARYLTPSGSSIQGVGVIPDIWLHPIFKQNVNQNLMGNYRYRIDGPFIGFKPSKKVLAANSQFINGYYLRDPERDFSPNKSKEVELALNIFDESKKIEVDKTPGEYSHPSSVILNLRNIIKAKIGKWDSEVTAYLKSRQINWLEETEHSLHSSVRIVDMNVTAPKKVFPGAPISVSFGVKNESNQGLARASVFIRSAHREMDTIEKLVGYIQPQSKIEEKENFEIPSSWLAGKVDFQVGIAIDGLELENTIQDFSLTLNERTEPALTISSKLQHALKTGETSDLLVNVKNEGDEDLHIDKIKITNLSGRQLIVTQDETALWHEIAAHQEQNISIKVASPKDIFSDHLALGFSLESHELKNPIYKIISISAVPTAKFK